MYLFKKVSDLEAFLGPYRQKRRTIGFVPTMGALHNGHLSLIRASHEQASCTVASIFVNPTQFNEASDLEKYPRTPAQDLRLLYQAGCQAVFMPPVEEVYPPNEQQSMDVDFGVLTTVMEGAHRPGHFDGVAQVVKRLLDIVQPTHLYMGQKDYQQVIVVRRMVDALAIDTEVVMCPIVREEDGLAMSSRNVRLDKESRQKAPAIYQALQEARAMLQRGESVQTIQRKSLDALSAAGLKPEYFELADAHSLQLVEDTAKVEAIVACTAAWAGDIRLIDNRMLKGSV